jgi:protein involved in ribonucleotide reduction
LRQLARDVIDEFYSMKRTFGDDKLCPGLDRTVKLLIESCTDFVIIGTKEDHKDVETEFDFTPKSIPIRDGDFVFVGTKEDLKDIEAMITVPTKRTKDNKKRDG